MIQFDSHQQILALDFDGVIADSIYECLFSGYNAYAGLTSRPQVHSLNEISAENVREAKRLRNFIRSGEDYVFIFLALSKGVQIQTQDAFEFRV